jgi:hypothetical protein
MVTEMRRRIGALVAVLALVGVASGCSLREVQLWFAFNRHQAISREQAKNIADLVNSKKAPGGCDSNYAGTCVPDNATQVHCAGTSGEGPAVRGPFTIAGWDSFELDPDGDKHVCDSPVGSFDVFGQELDGIRIKGWAFDPDTTDPIDLVVSTNGYIDQLTADESRGDLEAALPGVGADPGVDLSGGGWDPGEQVSVCVVAINVGTGSNTTLGCKNIVMADFGEFHSVGGDVYGMIESADPVPGGIRVRGFAVADVPSGAVTYHAFGTNDVIGYNGPDLALNVARDDVADAFGVSGNMYGFDQVIPTQLIYYVHGVCLTAVVPPAAGGGPTQLMCRPIGS